MLTSASSLFFYIQSLTGREARKSGKVRGNLSNTCTVAWIRHGQRDMAYMDVNAATGWWSVISYYVHSSFFNVTVVRCCWMSPACCVSMIRGRVCVQISLWGWSCCVRRGDRPEACVNDKWQTGIPANTLVWVLVKAWLSYTPVLIVSPASFCLCSHSFNVEHLEIRDDMFLCSDRGWRDILLI